MTHTIIIETQSDSVFEQVKTFARRIGVPFSETHTGVETTNQEEALKKFAGSWEGNETGDELVEMVYNARNDRPRNIELSFI